MSRPGRRTSIAGGHVDIAVRLTPRAGQDAIEGTWTGPDGRQALLAKVRAVPEKGAANAALLALIADRLGVPRSAVELVSGGTQRLKRVRVSGDAAELAGKVSSLGTVKPR